jgi:hypothetical protein
MTLLRRSALGSCLAVAMLAAPAAASEQHAHGPRTVAVEGLDALSTSSLTASRAVKRDCVAQPLAGRRGVATTTYRAAGDGQVTFRLAGTGDWDLAVFDSAGTLVASSAAFNASEVAQVGVREGTRLLVQACRRSGRAKSATLTSQLARVDWDSVPGVHGKISMVRVAVKDGAQIGKLEAAGFDVTHDVSAEGANVVLYGDEDLAKLRKTGLSFTTVIDDMVANRRAQQAEQREWARLVGGRSALPSGRTDYRVLADYQNELKEMAEKHPSLVRPFNIGKSLQGRDIQALEITENAQDGDDGRPVLFLNGIHHAREWPAAESIMEFAHELIKGYGKDPRVTKILRDTRVVVQPFTNPDGFQVSRSTVNDPDANGEMAGVYQTATGVVIFGGSLSYKRKNCNPLVPVPATTYPCPLAIGVDPNRNYPEGWGGPGASSNPNDQGYRGSGPSSEPETRAVIDFSSKSNTTILLSMHNVAAKVLRPPGLKKDGMAPDEDGLKGLGKVIADAAGYTNEYGYQLYETTGTTKDWVYAALGVYGYTVELGPASGDFHGNYKVHVVDQYEGAGRLKGRGLREGFLASAEWARDPSKFSRVAGRSVPGRTLRLTKKFQTETSPVCLIVDPTVVTDICAVPGAVQKVDEKVDMTMTVGKNGKFEWWVNPSTRPFVFKKGGRETYTLTCEDDGKVIETREVFVARGDIAQLGDIPCGGKIPSDAASAPSAPAAPAAGAPAPADVRGGAPSATAKQLAVRVLSVKRSGKRARIVLSVTGGAVRNAVVTLLDKRGKRVGSARVKSLAGRKTITVKSRRSLRRGTYRVRVTGAGMAAATRAVKLK